MNKIEDNPQRQFSIGQLAATTGVKRTTLGHWESEFRDYLETARSQGNQRRFTPESVEKIERIRVLIEEQGLSLHGVRKQLEKLAPPRAGPDPPAAEDPMETKARELADRVTERLYLKLFGK